MKSETVDVMLKMDKTMLVDGQRFVRVGRAYKGEMRLTRDGGLMEPWPYDYPTDCVYIIVEPVAAIKPSPGHKYEAYGLVPKGDDILWYHPQTDSWCPMLPGLHCDEREDGGRRHWARAEKPKYMAWQLLNRTWRAGNIDNLWFGPWADFYGSTAEADAHKYADNLNTRQNDLARSLLKT